MTTEKKKNIAILAFALVVVTIGYGLVMPIIPFYMENLGAGGLELGLLVASYAITRLIFGPIWGSLSDRFGRKPILLIGIAGYGLAMFFFGLATKLWMLFLARILSGILSAATSPTTMAYIVDNTEEAERSKAMGILGAVMGLGVILGPALGGLLSKISLSFPFFIASGLAFLSMLFTVLFLPESTEKQDSTKKIVIFPLKTIRTAFEFDLGKYLVLIMFISLAGATYFGMFGLYGLEKFGFGADDVGLVLMIVGGISAFSQGLLTGPLTKWLGEKRLILLSLSGTAVSLLVMPLVQSLVFLYLVIILFSLCTALLSPVLTAAISRQDRFEHGLTMGITNSFVSLGRILGPGLAGYLFDRWLELPNIISGLLILIGILVFVRKK